MLDQTVVAALERAHINNHVNFAGPSRSRVCHSFHAGSVAPSGTRHGEGPARLNLQMKATRAPRWDLRKRKRRILRSPSLELFRGDASGFKMRVVDQVAHPRAEPVWPSRDDRAAPASTTRCLRSAREKISDVQAKSSLVRTSPFRRA